MTTVEAHSVVVYQAICPDCGYLCLCAPLDLPSDNVIQCDDCYRDFRIEPVLCDTDEPSANQIVFTPDFDL